MFPTLFTIPGTSFSLHSFGLMLVIGLYAALMIAKRLARARGLDGEKFVNLGILALVSGLIGARASHVFENWGEYTSPQRSGWENFVAAINISSGGLTYYGGFILAFVVCMGYLVWKRMPIRVVMDVVAPCVMVGLAFGRIGCFLNGCCYGAEADLPWSVRFPYGSIAYVDQYNRGEIKVPGELLYSVREAVGGGGPDELAVKYPIPAERALRDPMTRTAALAQCSKPMHPAQLYSSLTAFLLMAITWAYFFTPHVAGRGMALMMMLEGPARFLLEAVRAEPAVTHVTVAGRTLGLSYSMVLGVGVFVAGVVLWVVMGVVARRRGGVESGGASVVPVQLGPSVPEV
jgi:phosphatidylglycerol:prolipoprotein diacylglycerol transferase